MAHIIAFSNQKGGVGKTTSAVSVAAELALMRYSVLLVDLDSQGNATSGLGIERNKQGEDLYDVFTENFPLAKTLKKHISPHLDTLSVVPSTKDLVGIDALLGERAGRERILKAQISTIASDFDYILIDCPPSLGILTINALTASDSVVIPLQSEYYALEGVTALIETINGVKQTSNPFLKILGVFLTMYDSRTNLSVQVESEAREFFGELMFETVIPRSIRLSEAPSHGLPIALYEPTSAGGKAYARLAEEIDSRVAAFSKAVANI